MTTEKDYPQYIKLMNDSTKEKAWDILIPILHTNLWFCDADCSIGFDKDMKDKHILSYEDYFTLLGQVVNYGNSLRKKNIE